MVPWDARKASSYDATPLIEHVFQYPHEITGRAPPTPFTTPCPTDFASHAAHIVTSHYHTDMHELTWPHHHNPYLPRHKSCHSHTMFDSWRMGHPSDAMLSNVVMVISNVSVCSITHRIVMTFVGGFVIFRDEGKYVRVRTVCTNCCRAEHTIF